MVSSRKRSIDRRAASLMIDNRSGLTTNTPQLTREVGGRLLDLIVRREEPNWSGGRPASLQDVAARRFNHVTPVGFFAPPQLIEEPPAHFTGKLRSVGCKNRCDYRFIKRKRPCGRLIACGSKPCGVIVITSDSMLERFLCTSMSNEVPILSDEGLSVNSHATTREHLMQEHR